jgi:TatD DNase family protein
LGIHPLYVPQASEDDLQILETKVREALSLNAAGQRADPRLVALGEIGLDLFVPSLCQPAMLEKQIFFYHAQLKLAQQFKLPVILHVRKSADLLLKGLRRFGSQGGIAHAFNGSQQQAESFLNLGFVLGFGGAMTFDRALQLRRLATELPLSALVLETDAPDIPPHWLYQTQAQRQSLEGLLKQNRNEPGEVAQIGAVLAQLRGLALEEVASATVQNTLRVLPQLAHIYPS